MISKNVSQIFKTLFQTENVNIFSRCVQLKRSFSNEKNNLKSETHFSREGIKV